MNPLELIAKQTKLGRRYLLDVKVVIVTLCAFLLAAGGLNVKLVLLCLAIMLNLNYGRAGIQGAWRSIRRIRVLLISLTLLALWGASIQSSVTQVLAQSLAPAVTLVCMILMVNWLFHNTAVNQLATTLARLLRPFSLLGLDVETAARRLSLSLQVIPEMQQQFQNCFYGGAIRHQKQRAKTIRQLASLLASIEADDGKSSGFNVSSTEALQAPTSAFDSPLVSVSS